MGTGKTTLGRHLAELLSLQFLDLDRLITARADMDIPMIFENRGEAAFRKMEREALQQVIGEFTGVIALGGGALQNQQVIDNIRKNGLLVFIETPISTILERIMRNRQRPLLLDDEGRLKSRAVLKAEVEERYQVRLPRYRQAHLTFKPDKHDNPEATARKLAQAIRKYVSTH